MARVREARPADADAIAVLLHGLGWNARLANTPLAALQATVARHLAMCLADASHSVYVAAGEDEQTVGYVAAHWLPYLMLAGPEGYVSELFVAQGARGQGVGRALLAAVEAEARTRGCARLQLINFRQRESYQRRFYEKNGWQERPDGASFVRAVTS